MNTSHLLHHDITEHGSMIKTLGNSGYYRYELKAQTYYSLNYEERTLLLMWSSYVEHLVERYIDEIRSQIEMFTNHLLRQNAIITIINSDSMDF